MLETRSRSFTIGTVLATSQGNDFSILSALLRGSAWKLVKVSSCGEAAQAMRRVLVEYARSRGSQRRGAGVRRLIWALILPHATELVFRKTALRE